MGNPDYDNYIKNDPRWIKVKENVSAAANGLCADCGEWGQDCHHLTYRHLFHELETNPESSKPWWTEEIIFLCRRCHLNRHPEKLSKALLVEEWKLLSQQEKLKRFREALRRKREQNLKFLADRKWEDENVTITYY